MQFDYSRPDGKESKEAVRFDRATSGLYKDDNQLIVEQVHWKKFEADKRIHHPYAHVVQSLGDLSGKKVLECGCGTGIFSVIMAKRGAAHIEAFDISRNSIGIAQRRAKINGIDKQVNFQPLSIYDMNYEENSFDYIVGMNILHHVDIERIADKIYRYLKPGGTAFFNEPFGNVRWLQRLRLLVPIKVNEEDRTHWDEQLKYRDFDKFKGCFQDVAIMEFHLFSRLDRVIKSKYILNMLAEIDVKILKRLPGLRKYARRIVITLKK